MALSDLSDPTNPEMLGKLKGSSPALTAMKNAATPAATPATPDPTVATAINVDTSKSDPFQQQAIQTQQNSLNQYNSTGDWAKQAGLNALSGAQRGASENAARQGLQSGGASYLAANSQGLVNGVNALNQQMSNWAQGAVQASQGLAGAYQGAANNALSAANANAGFENNASLNNTQYARDQLSAQQQNISAAQTGNVQTATNAYQAHKKWTGTSAAAGDWNAAQKAYYDAQAKGDTAGVQAALAKMTAVSQGSNYTSDGHSRNDPTLKNRADNHKKFSNGETWYYKGDNVIGKETPDGTFTYTGT